MTDIDEQLALSIMLSALRGESDAARATAVVAAITSPSGVRRMIAAAAESRALPLELRDAFHLGWTVRSHRIRDAVNDDNLLADALWQLLPPYNGRSLTLFRGEQAGRFDQGRVGFNWTANRAIAEQFARGLCASYPGGGVLVQANVDRAAIIAGPSAHSRYLEEDEVVVDPRRVQDVTELTRYPEIS